MVSMNGLNSWTVYAVRKPRLKNTIFILKHLFIINLKNNWNNEFHWMLSVVFFHIYFRKTLTLS
jgi:hypothetical protein